MARQSARRPAPARPSGRSAFGGNSTQTRQASTMAAAPAAAYSRPAAAAAPAHPVAAQPQQPGLFAQMASTAAGVAVGSAVGHTMGAGLTSLFSGSDAPQEVQQVAQQQQQVSGGQCEADARNFTRCLEDSNGNYQACDFYLQQLKACQQAAAPY